MQVKTCGIAGSVTGLIFPGDLRHVATYNTSCPNAFQYLPIGSFQKGDGLRERCARCLRSRYCWIDEPNRHAAVQDLACRGRNDVGDSAVVFRPCDLGAAVDFLRAQQEHHGLQIHSRVTPLRWRHIAVEIAEQGCRRAEAVPVLGAESGTGDVVVLSNTEGAVAKSSEVRQTLPVRTS